MYLRVRCPSCGKSSAVPETDAGLPAVCLACGSRYTIPEAAPAPLFSGPAAADSGTSDVDAAGPRRWGRMAWAAAALVVVTVVVAASLVARARPDPVDRPTAALYKSQAEAAAASGQLSDAYRKYHELELIVGDRPVRNPETRALVDKARADKDKVYALLLDQMSHQQKEAQARAAAARSRATFPAPSGPQEPAPVAAQGALSVSIPTTRDPETPAAAPDREAVAIAPTPPEPSAAPEPAPSPSTPTTRDAAPADAEPAAPRVALSRPPVEPMPEPAYGVTDEQIGRAIEKGVANLLAQFNRRTYSLEGVSLNNADGGGRNALAVYALMQAGQAVKDERLNVRGPDMDRKIKAMTHSNLRNGHPQVYALGIRATALSVFNRPQDRETLKQDVGLLLQAHTGGAYWYLADPRLKKVSGGGRGPWDNSNSQYGLLGVWSGAEAGIEVPGSYWAAVDAHWEATQLPDGEWSYAGDRGGKLSMTMAGIASLFVTHDWLDAPKYGFKVGREPFSPALKKALDWLETGDNAVEMTNAEWWGYTIYGIERVGLASGFKYFGRHDWYRALAGRIVAAQSGDGSWGDSVDTSYALLFLSRGRHPILMNKLRFDGYWANRPRDVANLARFATRQLERELNWQVVPLRPLPPSEDGGALAAGGGIGFRPRMRRGAAMAEPWSDWMDSPVLYLASHKPPKLMDGDYDNLRAFVEAGGLLFTHSDGDASEEHDGAFDQWVERELAPKLFPKYEVKDLPADHAAYNLVYKLEDAERPRLRAVSNGSRLLLVHSPVDIARAWQLRDTKTKAGLFRLGVNLFLYASGRRDLRNRLESPYVSDPGPAPAAGHGTVQVARLQYVGNWDPEPGAWRRFGRWFQRQTGTAVHVRETKLATLAADALSPAHVPLAHLTGNARYDFTDAEAAAVRKYVEGGGVLLIDQCGGSGPFDQSVQETLLPKAFPGAALRPMPMDTHPLFRGGPRDSGTEDLTKARLRPFNPDRAGNAERPFSDFTFGQGRVIFTPVDLTCGLLGTRTWGIAGFEPDYAQSFLKNLLFWVVDGRPEPSPGSESSAPATKPTTAPAAAPVTAPAR
jgi:hypothetical protein